MWRRKLDLFVKSLEQKVQANLSSTWKNQLGPIRIEIMKHIP